MRSAPAIVPILILLAAGLSGCADDETPPETGEAVDQENFELATGKGAIAGLLVDDRFRPIHLTDDPTTEFQTAGFVLLQETGEQVQTTENGEFFFVDLDPGTYTLRVSAAGHEAVPSKVSVTSGAFAEASVVARRTVNEGGTIITQEFAIFVDCWYQIQGVITHTEVNCFADLSRDSKRGALRYNFSAVSDVTYIIAEFLMNEPGEYRVDVGWGDGEAVTETYAARRISGGDYGKLLLSTDQAEAEMDENIDGFLPQQRLLAVLWPQGDPVGFGVAVEAQVLVSLFIGEPEVDLQAYCVLCP